MSKRKNQRWTQASLKQSKKPKPKRRGGRPDGIQLDNIRVRRKM